MQVNFRSYGTTKNCMRQTLAISVKFADNTKVFEGALTIEEPEEYLITESPN